MSLTNAFAPADTAEESLSFNAVLQQSYSHAVKHVQDGVALFKEEMHAIYDKAGDCLNKMVLPVNNFLKESLQIEKELQLEFTKECICQGSTEHTLYLEENY